MAPNHGGGKMMLPDELVLEILTWLPGKQLGQCQCVCKSWRSIIRSPLFLETYKCRQPGLLLYIHERINPGTRTDRKDTQVRFFYSTLLLRESEEEFSCLYELRMAAYFDRMTQVVNGLTCVCENGEKWILYNVCTGQRMAVPVPTPVRINPFTASSFQIGYDPGKRVYKLLRLILKLVISDNNQRDSDYNLEAEIITLRPSNSLSTWRSLDYKEAGIADLPGWIVAGIIGAKTFSGDGVLYWLQSKSLLSFDLDKEKFRLIKLPDHLINLTNGRLGRWNLAETMGCLALWLPPQGIDHLNPEKFILLVLEDDEGSKWNKRCIQLPKQLVGNSPNLTVVVGKLPTGEILLMNSSMEDQVHHFSRPVYSYDHRTNKFDRFSIGKLPPCLRGGPSLLGDFYRNPRLDAGDDGGVNNNYGSFHRSCHDSTLCLLDNNNLYLSLDDALCGGV